MKKANKNSGFKTPEGYFESLPAKLLSKISNEEVTLPNSDVQHDGFRVPQSYFENLTQDILEKVDKKETKVVSLYKKYYYVAASIAAVFVVFFAIRTNTNKTPSFDSLTSSTIENYFEDYELDFNENELAELLPIHDVEINDILNKEINQEGIVEYLDNNIEDLQELNNIYDEE
ncbi:hypothetical protein GGR42_002555 [Saonia flava]|uniref:Uncharacterized protein n=1 Tax=Saonia flava TaxID=523696 RepID=A0A846R3Y3_9FLAO|nr:hypothetical protein [Saonia flava]NJB72064.1 hypothetical protein [Saonia flava]